MRTGDQYAAFIMTYRRTDVLPDTIRQILSQTFPPSKILIVDNDPERSAAKIAEQFPGKNIGYYAVGYNAGPAGAAYHGLKILFEEDWQWVLWMDDNDPPHFPDVIEHLFAIPGRYTNPDKIGMLGAVGVIFDRNKAKTIRVPDEELKGILEVDNVAGNMMPIVHRRVYEKDVFPDTDLFFGFEELDFSLAIKRAGMKVLVSGEELYRHRKNAGRLNMQRKIYQVKDVKKLWREYYSVRNIVYILRYKEKASLGTMNLFFRIIAKSLIGFRYGWEYGVKNSGLLFRGFKDGWKGKLGHNKAIA